jgi:hypothetical protein
MAITKEFLDELLKDYQKPEGLLGQFGLFQQLSKAISKRVLDEEMTHHRFLGVASFVRGSFSASLAKGAECSADA